MTALCGGGTSQPQTGVATVVSLTSIAVEAFLTSVGFPEIAPIVAALIAAGLTIETATFCSTDPPADPGLTATDLVDVLNFADPTVSLPAIAKFRQWFQHRYWWQICTCTSGSPTPPTALSDPGPLGTNSGLPAGGNSQCFDMTETGVVPSAHSARQFVDMTPGLVPNLGTSVTSTQLHSGNGGTGITGPVYPIPATLQKITFVSSVVQVDPGVSVGGQMLVQLNFTDSAGNWINGAILQQAISGRATQTLTFTRGVGAWDPTATYFEVNAGSALDFGASTSQAISVEAIGTCSGSPLQSECCPPDPGVVTKLDAIYQLLQAVFLGLPATVNSLSEGTSHTGLSGSGSLALAAATIAVKAVITATGSVVGESAGDPTEYFGAGFLTSSAVEGNYQSVRLESSPQLLVLPLLADAIHWTLGPGVVITLVELSKGP